MRFRGFTDRLRHAVRGVREGFRQEANFRIQLLAACCAIASLLWLRPPLIWAALIAILIGLVLAAELLNTALERALDGLHPKEAEFVRIAKDCSAAAVLILSATAAVVFLAMLTAIL